jgi:Replication-relaxation
MYPKLTPRDIQVILSLYKCRYLTGTQIERLHFPSTQVMWRRMKSLLDLGFIKSFTAPHIPERIFYLDKKGAEIVAIESRLSMEELHWHSHQRVPKDYYFLRHFLAVNDFYIVHRIGNCIFCD